MPYDMFDEEGKTSPARVIATTGRTFPAVLFVGTVAIVVSAALFAIACLVMWPMHVWLFNNQTNLQNHVYQNSYGTQQSDLDSMDNAIRSIAGAMDAGQAASDANDACKWGARVNELPPGDQDWYTKNCDGPALSPSSPYYVSVNS